MPLSVQKKYRRDLMDVARARDYLFEIHIAWHFYLRDHDLQWYEDDGQKHPEFLVKTPSFDFNVECKRISVDTSRQIKREDFYRLVQDLESILKTPERPIYSKAKMPLKGFRDEKTKDNKQI